MKKIILVLALWLVAVTSWLTSIILPFDIQTFSILCGVSLCSCIGGIWICISDY